ncbi:MAG TPA: hypothetical protein PKD37_02165 [Oligoflexia bacterium]|nr:hypothetical protein [Oligoflexia bacterium]HMP26776.1 hypothetical protein [Oligoflexia bacterium]
MRYIELKPLHLWWVIGKDAERYLNARLTNNIKLLKTGDYCLAAALSAQGRTEGLFVVVRQEDKFIVYTVGGEKEKTFASLRKFVVADRVEFFDKSAEHRLFHVIERDGSESKLEKELFLLKESGGGTTSFLSLSIDRAEAGGRDILTDFDFDFKSQICASPITFEEFEFLRIKNKRPAFPSELNESSLFLEGGWSEPIAFNKGCYIGQEVVEKITAIGEAPRVLKVLCFANCSHKISADERVCNDSGEIIGKIVSSATDSKERICYAFALLRNDPNAWSSLLFAGGVAGEIYER